MAQANLGSRRSCEDLIRQGRVRVNGKVVRLGDQADPEMDIIEVDGEKLAFPDRKTYIAFNKPKHVISDDGAGDDPRRTARSYINFEGHLFTIGRLDADSEGLLVLTNDGELANRLTHPRYRHTKTYKVTVQGLPSQETLEQWEKGVYLVEDDGTAFKTAPCSVKIMHGGKETILRVVMTEGKKRQIRRVASSLGHPVISLLRTHIGNLALGELRPAEWRELNAKDIRALSTPADELREFPRVKSMRAARSRKPAAPGDAPAAALGDRKPRRPAAKPGDRRKPSERPDRGERRERNDRGTGKPARPGKSGRKKTER
jgi:pseudouridine synthase